MIGIDEIPVKKVSNIKILYSSEDEFYDNAHQYSRHFVVGFIHSKFHFDIIMQYSYSISNEKYLCYEPVE